MTIDITRPVETEFGDQVRLICTDRKGDYPLVGLVDEPGLGTEKPCCWSMEGNPWNIGARLRNVPRKCKGWVAVICLKEFGPTNTDSVRRTTNWYSTEEAVMEAIGDRSAQIFPIELEF